MSLSSVPVRIGLVMCTLLCAQPVFAQNDSAVRLRLDATSAPAGTLPLAGHLQVLHDPTGDLDLDRIRSPGYAGQFERVPGAFNGGYTDGAWWVRIDLVLAPDAARRWHWLRLYAPETERLDVWLPRFDEEGWAHHRLGTLNPASARAFLDTGFPVETRHLPDGPSTIWLRLSGKWSLSLNGAFHTAASMPRQAVSDMVWAAAMLSLVLVLMVISGAMAVALRDRHFLAFALHMVVLTLIGTRGTLFYAMVLPDSPEAVSLLRLLASPLGLFTSNFMAYVLLDIRQDWPRLATVMRGVMVLAVLLMVAILFGYAKWVGPLVNGLLIPSNALWLVIAALRMKRRVPEAGWIFAAYLGGAGTTLLYHVDNLGLLNFGGWAREAAKLGVVIFACAIAIALGVRTFRLERTARQTRRRALEASRAARERLESAVQERTRELREEIGEHTGTMARLEQALNEQRNFLAMVSHEFRTPLSTIETAASVAAADSADNEFAHKEIGKIGRAARRMAELVDALLAGDRLDANLAPAMSSFDLVELVSELCERHGAINERRIVVHATQARIPVHAEETMLRVVIDSLLDNAVKYCPGDAPIEVDVEREDRSAVLRVRDHGRGIRESDLERIFERYWRAPDAAARPGLGLGLDISRRIVRRNGGSISASNAPDGGAVFTVRLPDAPSE